MSSTDCDAGTGASASASTDVEYVPTLVTNVADLAWARLMDTNLAHEVRAVLGVDDGVVRGARGVRVSAFNNYI